MTPAIKRPRLSQASEAEIVIAAYLLEARR
jgi:hypothetical protein